MKKILLIILLMSCNLHSQIIFSENFESFPEDNIGAYSRNQINGWYSMPYGGNWQPSDLKVVNNQDYHNKVVKITGNNSGDVYLYKDFTDNSYSAWQNYQVEFDFYTGPLNASNQSVQIFLQKGLVVLAGLEINLGTLKVNGWTSYNPGLDPDYNKAYKLGTNNTDVTLLPNTWYRLGFSFRKSDGEVKFVEKSGLFDVTVYSAATGSLPNTFFARVQYKSNTTIMSSALIDNVTFEKTRYNTLNIEKNELNRDTTFLISPNPSQDFITIYNYANKNINSILFFDVTGKVVKESNLKNNSEDIKINISDLSSGLYLVKIISDDDYIIKKMIKQ